MGIADNQPNQSSKEPDPSVAADNKPGNNSAPPDPSAGANDKPVASEDELSVRNMPASPFKTAILWVNGVFAAAAAIVGVFKDKLATGIFVALLVVGLAVAVWFINKVFEGTNRFLVWVGYILGGAITVGCVGLVISVILFFLGYGPAGMCKQFGTCPDPEQPKDVKVSTWEGAARFWKVANDPAPIVTKRLTWSPPSRSGHRVLISLGEGLSPSDYRDIANVSPTPSSFELTGLKPATPYRARIAFELQGFKSDAVEVAFCTDARELLVKQSNNFRFVYSGPLESNCSLNSDQADLRIVSVDPGTPYITYHGSVRDRLPHGAGEFLSSNRSIACKGEFVGGDLLKANCVLENTGPRNRIYGFGSDWIPVAAMRGLFGGGGVNTWVAPHRYEGGIARYSKGGLSPRAFTVGPFGVVLEGQGVLSRTTTLGTSYMSGTFHNGALDGYGEMRETTGQRLKGTFDDGTLLDGYIAGDMTPIGTAYQVRRGGADAGPHAMVAATSIAIGEWRDGTITNGYQYSWFRGSSGTRFIATFSKNGATNSNFRQGGSQSEACVARPISFEGFNSTSSAGSWSLSCGSEKSATGEALGNNCLLISREIGISISAEKRNGKPVVWDAATTMNTTVAPGVNVDGLVLTADAPQQDLQGVAPLIVAAMCVGKRVEVLSNRVAADLSGFCGLVGDMTGRLYYCDPP